MFNKTILYRNSACSIIHGDSSLRIPDLKNKIDLIVTSPPYADARKNHYDSVSPGCYAKWFKKFHLMFWEALTPNGNLIINIKDKVVNGSRHRYVWQTIQALNSLGWLSIDDFIWSKTNSTPGYWPNRLRDSWEYCFHLAKNKKPYFNVNDVKIPVGNWLPCDKRKEKLKQEYSATKSGFTRTRKKLEKNSLVNPSNVLNISVECRNQGHPAVFPVSLPTFFIKLLCPPGGIVLDPFSGSGTTGLAALKLGRNCVLIDNKIEYCEIAFNRLQKEVNKTA